MKIIKTIKQMQSFSFLAKQNKKKIGFVPTMGCLHAGHLSLIKRSKKENDITVLSIFVNPTQFGPKEDFKKYPREKKQDEALAKKEKVDIIFYPSIKEMYPTGYLTYVNVSNITTVLCGKSRPGHFQGVTTIVAKLINCVMPDTLYLGQKDSQQAVVVERMIKDLGWNVKIKLLPIVREKDGLAMSSRNIYLNSEERKQATCLYQSLKAAKNLIYTGERYSAKIIKEIKKIVLQNPRAKIDYIACVDMKTLKPTKMINKKTLIALAIFIGKIRLIDNIIIDA
ncbi:MAG: pantoate--beta-alanine ligase [Candidatus Omnitrophica bacterium]|nr:pantoate--beta-alanine ligase [Candidatus Omnitrophota bacterium]